MRCVFEFFDIPREIARARVVEIELSDGCTVLDALCELGRRVPGLVGPVIAPDGSLLSPYLLNLNGAGYVDDLLQELEDNDRLSLMFPPAGG